jgi:hypothetical protein
MRVADQLRHLARHQEVGGLGMQQADGGIVERHVERLALARLVAMMQRQQHADHAVQSHAEIDQRRAHAHRPGVLRAVDAHQPGHRLHSGVVAGQAAIGTVIAEAGDVAIDQLRELRLEHLLVADAPFLERAGLEVVDQDVGGLEQAQQHLAPLGLGEVERRHALVAVHADEVRRGAVAERRAPVAHLVALRRLDLDDVGAVVGEHLRAVGPAEHAGQVDDADAKEARRYWEWSSRP